MSNGLTHQNVVGELLKRVPSFAAVRNVDESYVSYDDDSPYLIFADFSRFLLNQLSPQSQEDENEATLQRSFNFLNDMLTSRDPEVVNLAQVAILEPFAQEPTALEIAKCYISGEANIILEQWVQGWLSWLARIKEQR